VKKTKKEKNLKSYQVDMIEDILKNFDFERVNKCMKVLDWGWFNTDGTIPSKYELESTARVLLQRVIKERLKQLATGGFEVIYYKKEKILELKFVVESYDITKEDCSY
jgi:hypothetical protein